MYEVCAHFLKTQLILNDKNRIRFVQTYSATQSLTQTTLNFADLVVIVVQVRVTCRRPSMSPTGSPQMLKVEK